MDENTRMKYKWLPAYIPLGAAGLILLGGIIWEICTGVAGGGLLFWQFFGVLVLIGAFTILRELKRKDNDLRAAVQGLSDSEAMVEHLNDMIANIRQSLQEKDLRLAKLSSDYVKLEKNYQQLLNAGMDNLQPDDATPAPKRKAKMKVPVTTGLTYGDNTIMV